MVVMTKTEMNVVFLKKLGLLLVAVAAIYFLPFFIYGMLVDSDIPEWFAYTVFGAAGLALVGGIIYLAVDAAQRHNR